MQQVDSLQHEPQQEASPLEIVMVAEAAVARVNTVSRARTAAKREFFIC